MPPAQYGSAESLFRAVHADLARAAYGLLGHHADAEDAVQNSFYQLMVAWNRVGNLDEDGAERVIAERGPGDLIGEGGTAPGNVRSASVIALEPVRALVMTTGDYAAFVAGYPGVPDLVMKQTYDRPTVRPGRP